MSTATVGTKHQIVIPKEVREKIKDFRPGDKVMVSSMDDKTIKVTTSTDSWLQRTAGLMTNAWKGNDNTTKLEHMRDEWEERLAEFEKPAR